MVISPCASFTTTFTADTTMGINATRLDHTSATGLNNRPASLRVDTYPTYLNSAQHTTGLDPTYVNTDPTGLNATTQHTNVNNTAHLNTNLSSLAPNVEINATVFLFMLVNGMKWRVNGRSN